MVDSCPSVIIGELDRPEPTDVMDWLQANTDLRQLSYRMARVDTLRLSLLCSGNPFLDELRLYSPRSCKLPDSLGQCTTLRALSITHCDLKMLPESIGLRTNLERLIISDNPRFKGLPYEIGQCTNLVYIEVSGTQLTNLPGTLGRCTRLSTLRINGNGLTAMPNAIGRCASLKDLQISDNRLTVLPDTIG